MNTGDVVAGSLKYEANEVCDAPGEGAYIIGSLLHDQIAIILASKPKYEFSPSHGYNVHRFYHLVFSSGTMMLGWVNSNRLRLVWHNGTCQESGLA